MTAWRLVAPPFLADGALALARTLRRQYLRCLEKGLVTATITEFCSTDGYGLLAAHHYFYAGIFVISWSIYISYIYKLINDRH